LTYKLIIRAYARSACLCYGAYCSRFLTGVADDGTPQLGEPILIMTNTPIVPPCGEITLADAVWPDVLALAPSYSVASSRGATVYCW